VGLVAGLDLDCGEGARVALRSVCGGVEREGARGVRELMSSASAFRCEVLENGRAYRNVWLGDVAALEIVLSGDRTKARLVNV
jgi:hypothetical protein